MRRPHWFLASCCVVVAVAALALLDSHRAGAYVAPMGPVTSGNTAGTSSSTSLPASAYVHLACISANGGQYAQVLADGSIAPSTYAPPSGKVLILTDLSITSNGTYSSANTSRNIYLAIAGGTWPYNTVLSVTFSTDSAGNGGTAVRLPTGLAWRSSTIFVSNASVDNSGVGTTAHLFGYLVDDV
jgi:hypothetical protein